MPLLRVLFILVFFPWAIPVFGACTGSSPNLSAPDSGNVTTNGSNLQACLNAAVGGDTITLTAGVEYRGTGFTFPAKTGSSVITVQTSADGSLPINVRVSPSSASSMPLLTTTTGTAPLTFAPDSDFWTMIGLNVSTASGFPASTRTPGLIVSQDTVTYGHWPDHLIFDRMYVHAFESDPLPYRAAEEGFILDGSNITIKNSWIGNFMGWEYPSVARTVTAATNANPVQVTFSASIGADPGHKFLLYFDGATGAWTPLNGPKAKVATWVDSTHATLQSYDETTFALSNINSTGFGSFSGQTVSQYTTSIATSRAVLIQVGPGPYTLDNNFLEAYYTPIFTGGGTWMDPAHSTTVSAVGSITQVTLNSVTDLQVGDLVAFSALQDQQISGATAGTTTSITVPTMTYPAGTGLYPEGCITISGFTGSWAPLNGNWGGSGNGCGTGSVTVIDSTHLSIPINSSGFGSVTSSSPKWVATIKQNSGPSQWSVGKVTNIAGNVVTYSWWGHQPENVGGNGAGILVANGAIAKYRGRLLDGVTVTRNTLSNRRNWIWLIRDVAKSEDNPNGAQPPKAAWEAKQGQNVSIIGNIIQIEGGNLSPKQGVVCMGLNQASQNGDTPWTGVSNWVIRHNLFRNYTYQKFSLIEEFETGRVSSGVVFDNNILTQADGSFFSFEGGDSVTVTHNTTRNQGGIGGGGYNAFMVIFHTNTNSIVQDNIGNYVLYGYDLLDAIPWTPTRSKNYLIDSTSQNFTPSAGDVRVPNDAAMLFVNAASADAGGDYHGYQLQAGSPGHNASTTGNDVGVNFATFDAAQAGVSLPTSTTSGGKTATGGKTAH